MTMMMSLANLYLLLLLLFITLISSSSEEIVKINNNHQRRQMSSPSILEFTANLDYNKLYQRSLNIHHARVVQMEPKEKLWFAIENGTLYALPLFGDYPGPFLIRFQPWSNGSTTDLHPSIELNLNFNFTPSSSLFSPSNHLLLALFNMSSTNYNHSLLNRYYAVRTLALALNLSESLLTIHRINGSMIKVYFSCDLYISTNLTDQLKSLIDHYYSRRLQLVPLFSLPLIEISIVRVQKSTTTTTTTTTPLTTTLSTTSTSSTTTTTTTTTTSKTKTTTTTSSAPSIELKKAEVTIRPRLLNDHHPLKFNRTVTSLNNLFALKQFYQPLVLVPLAIIAVGLFLCAIIACCLCCNRRSSSSSTLLIPTGSTSTSPTHKNLFRHYPYRKHRQKYDLAKKKHQYHDQRQFISKGIPVVFAEELEEKIEQTHTPLVMRIEKAPVQETVEAEAQPLDKSTL